MKLPLALALLTLAPPLHAAPPQDAPAASEDLVAQVDAHLERFSRGLNTADEELLRECIDLKALTDRAFEGV